MAKISDEERAIRQRLKDDFTIYAQKCLKIRSKSGAIEPFLLNKAQRYVIEKIDLQRITTGKIRCLVLKGRQQGISTLIEGRFYWRTTHAFGCQAFILTHALDATANLYKMVQRYHEHCPALVRPQASTSNSKELLFGKLDSGYKIGTAENKAVGRSSTIQLFHGCLAEGAKIYDPVNSGIRSIEKFVTGDYVLTHTGQTAQISFISNQKKECLSVKLRTLSAFPLQATPEHRFLTKDGWKELKDLKVEDSIGYPIAKIESMRTQFILPEPAIRKHGGGRQFKCPELIDVDYNLGRVVGLYLAEGHIKLQAKKPCLPCCISFAVHRKEVDRTVEWLKPFERYYSSISVRNRTNSLTSTVTIYGSQFATLMQQICGRTTDKHLNNLWREFGEDFCRGVLHGYLSGDGGSYKTDRRIRASSICNAITITMRDISASLGYGWASIEYKAAGIRHGRNEKEIFTFSLCGEGALRLAKEIGKESPEIIRNKTTSIKLNAANTTKISDGYAWLRINSIGNCGIKNVYDFEIDHEDHSYCTIHGATHNSEVAFWANAAEHTKGILQAVPNDAGTEVFLESTANGLGNYFHEQWQLAETGESEFIPIFIPWHWQDEYRRIVGPEFNCTAEESEIKRLYNLSDEQIAWRRYKIIELSASGINGTKSFKQEYPCTPTEAFQTSGEDTYIDPDVVMLARKGIAERFGPLVIGVDPARFGDDRTSIIRRQGRQAYNLQSYSKKDTMEVAGLVHQIILGEHPAKCFIDIGGLGAGVYDRLKELGHGDIIVAVNSGSTPLNQNKYYNKRAEMWGEMLEWLKTYPVQIPDCDTLHADLCSIRYKFDSNSRLALEPKPDMKKRGLRSPDEAEALALTFAYPLKPEAARRKDNEVAQSILSSYNKLDKLKKAAYR